MMLTSAEITRARRIARYDYEVRGLLAAYLGGMLDDAGVVLLLEEVDDA